MEIHDWLAQTTAADIMTRDVVTLTPDDIIAVAAAVLHREQISGVPIVNSEKKCVGVFSISDLIRAQEGATDDHQKVTRSTYFSSGPVFPVAVYDKVFAAFRDKSLPAADFPIGDFMTTDLVSVQGETPLSTVIQSMVDAHIHRVVVLDRDGRLVGLVSTTDVLGALLRGS